MTVARYFRTRYGVKINRERPFTGFLRFERRVLTAKVDGAWARKRAIRRDELLTVAADLFCRRGFTGVGIDEIGRAAGLSGPAIYKYFARKDDILVGILKRGTAKAYALFDPIARKDVPPADALREMVDAYIDYAHTLRVDMVVAVREVINIPEAYRDEFIGDQKAVRELNVDLLCAARPELSRRDARLLCSHVFQGMISSSVYLFMDFSQANRRRLLARAAMGALFA